VKKRTFGYDANGNMTSDTDHASSNNNREIKYAAFEKPVYIKKGISNPSQITFRYGSSCERYRRIDNVYEGSTPVSIETTYLGAYEKVVHTGGAKDGDTEHKYYIGGVAIKIDTEKSGLPGKTTKTKYLLKDHLGSVVAIKDHNDGSEQRFRYDPFGKQYQVTSTNPYTAIPVIAKLGTTDRGFTGHEMLNSVDIIHMNGRIYDANIGRFMQADAYIQAPKNMQNMNRYAYVLNNPLSYTDPSGHFFKSLARFISKFKVLNWALQAASCFYGGPAGCGAYAAAMSYGNGATLGQAIKSGAIAAFTAKVFQEIGSHFNEVAQSNWTDVLEGELNPWDLHGFGGNFLTKSQITSQIALHAFSGGVIAELNGGKFGHGFASAGFTKGLGNPLIEATGDNLVAGTLVSMVVGGTASALSGGKFANGAQTAMYQALFNYFGGGTEYVPKRKEKAKLVLKKQGPIGERSPIVGDIVIVETITKVIHKHWYMDHLVGGCDSNLEGCVDTHIIEKLTITAQKGDKNVKLADIQSTKVNGELKFRVLYSANSQLVHTRYIYTGQLVNYSYKIEVTGLPRLEEFKLSGD